MLTTVTFVRWRSENLAWDLDPRGILEIKELQTIDVGLTDFTDKKEYIPSHTYNCTVAADGEIGIVRRPNPSFLSPLNTGRVGKSEFLEQIRKEPDTLAEGAVRIGEINSKWEDVRFEGADRTFPEGAPRLVFDLGGVPILAWLQWDPPYPLGQPRIVIKRRLPDGTWSDKTILSDADALDITSFSLVSKSSSQLEVLWTDAREKHAVRWWLPTHRESFLKVFGRTYSDGRSGPVLRITPQKGKYDSDRVKARADPLGRIYAVWDQTSWKGVSQLFLSVMENGTWSPPIQISEDAPRSEVLYPQTSPHPLPNYHMNFDVVPLRAGKAVIFWSRTEPSEDLVYRIYDRGKLGSIDIAAVKSCNLNVAASSDGAIHLIYQESDPYARLAPEDRAPSFHKRHLYYQRWQAGQWSERQEIASNVFLDSTSIAVDAKDRIHLFWQQFINEEAHLVHAVGEPRLGMAPPPAIR